MCAQSLHRIDPGSPDESNRQSISATVKLEVTGRLSDVEVVSATPGGISSTPLSRRFAMRVSLLRRRRQTDSGAVVIEVKYDHEGRYVQENWLPKILEH